MSFCYLYSFDFLDLRHNFGTVTFTKSGGASFTVSIPSDVANGPVVTGDARTTVYNHYPTGLGHMVAEDSEGSTGMEYLAASQSWSQLFQQRMRQRAQAEGWSSYNSLTCTFDIDTHRYTFGYSGTFTAIEFSTLFATEETRKLFGFSGNFSGASTSVTGTLTPTFCIVPDLSAVTTDGTDGVNYEPTGISMQAVSEFGSVFGITRSSVPLFRDWTQQSEAKAKTLRLSASSSHPGTHQELFEKSRSMFPFVVVDGFGDGKDYAFRLRPDACMWNASACKRAGGDMDDVMFDVKYEAQVLGVFEDDEDAFSGQLVINGFFVEINGNPVVVNG